MDKAGLEIIAASCSSGSCPTIYRDALGSVVVQGYVVDPATAGVSVPEGELLVRIPADLIAEAFQKLG